MITLTRHFLRGLFDFGILTQAGADSFTRMLLSGLAGLLAAGFAMTRFFAGRYQALGRAASAEPYRRAVIGDDMLIVGLPMLLAALVTLLISDALFLDERDFRILGPLPLRKVNVFITKSLALLSFNAMFITVIHAALVPVMLITSANRWRDQTVVERLLAWLAASVTASAFAVLAMTAIVGIMVLALSRTRLVVLTALLRGTLLAALVACVPLLLRLPTHGGALANGAPWLAFVPPAWFVALERVWLGHEDAFFAHLASIARTGVVVAAAVVAVVYIVLFSHFEMLMLRSFARPSSRPKRLRMSGGGGSTPAFRAVFRFTATTLVRSQFHQSVLVGLSGCGVALAMNGATTWAPFALMFACAVGGRAALALPLEHHANWIFRLTEDAATRSEQLRAVDQIVSLWMVGPPVALAVSSLWLPLGLRGAIGTVVVALVGLVSVHAVMADWRRIPFTSSYLPGKRFVVQTFVLGCLAWLTFTGIGVGLVDVATRGPLQTLVVTATLAMLAYGLRRRRIEMFRRTPLMFEDELPDQPLQLELQR
jgi:hypothetical protein